MLISIKFNNLFIFSSETQFSMKADMRSSKLLSNVFQKENESILKTACIYGSNNSGKTCLIKVIRLLWGILLNKPSEASVNWFTDNLVFDLSVVFLQDGNEWEFSVKFNTDTHEYLYESFSKVSYDVYKNRKTELFYERDLEKNIFYSKDCSLADTLKLIGKNNILIHLIDVSSLEYLKKAKEILTAFASRIVIIDMNNIPLDNTIRLLKKHDALQNDIVSFIKNADLDLEDYKYLDEANLHIDLPYKENQKPEEDVLAQRIHQNLEDSLRIISYYKGKPVPSLLTDSTGTKKMAALASFVVSALKKGQILVIDELDSSIHFKLTRAVVSMFNNELNDNAQLIFSAHDISLLDCKRLFRKEQIWFVHKDDKGVYLYPLSDFTAEDGVRDTTDIIEKYKRGILGAIPEPDLLQTLIKVKNE